MTIGADRSGGQSTQKPERLPAPTPQKKNDGRRNKSGRKCALGRVGSNGIGNDYDEEAEDRVVRLANVYTLVYIYMGGES
jgi:hypothetical protein